MPGGEGLPEAVPTLTCDMALQTPLKIHHIQEKRKTSEDRVKGRCFREEPAQQEDVELV